MTPRSAQHPYPTGSKSNSCGCSFLKLPSPFFHLHPCSSSLKKPPQGLGAPFPLGFSFYLFPLLERIKCLSLQRATWQGGRQTPLQAQASARGAAKSKSSKQRGGNRRGSIGHNSCNPRSAPTYPKYDIEAKYEIFDATTDFRTLVVLPGHPLGS